jgi:hypothetical protein
VNGGHREFLGPLSIKAIFEEKIPKNYVPYEPMCSKKIKCVP